MAEALQKLGLDTSREHPRVLTHEIVAASDMAITLGCGEECPYISGVKYVDWPVADPGGQDDTVRGIIVGTHNAGRSALGAALARRRAGAQATVLSAGMAR